MSRMLWSPPHLLGPSLIYWPSSTLACTHLQHGFICGEHSIRLLLPWRWQAYGPLWSWHSRKAGIWSNVHGIHDNLLFNEEALLAGPIFLFVTLLTIKTFPGETPHPCSPSLDTGDHVLGCIHWLCSSCLIPVSLFSSRPCAQPTLPLPHGEVECLLVLKSHYYPSTSASDGALISLQTTALIDEWYMTSLLVCPKAPPASGP